MLKPSDHGSHTRGLLAGEEGAPTQDAVCCGQSRTLTGHAEAYPP